MAEKNVWANTFIDDFQKLINDHHSSIGSFRRVGSMLETSGRIYGIKVDSVHSDVFRLSSGIRRRSTVNQSVDDIISDLSSVRHERRPRPMIIGNGQLINAPLQTVDEPIRFLVAQNEFTVKDLLQNVLPSDKYALSLQAKNKLWLERDSSVANEMGDESVILNGDSVDLRISNWIPSSTDVLRPRLTEYSISRLPCSYFRCLKAATSNTADEYNEVADDTLNLHFDADVTVDNEGTTANLDAVDDLRPLTLPQLQYSYRRLTSDSLMANASHWRPPAIVQQNHSGNTNNRRGIRRKTKIKDKPVEFETVLSESFDQKFISVDDRRVSAIRKANQAKWNANKLTRPSNIIHVSVKQFIPLIVDSLENDVIDDCESNGHVTAGTEEIGPLHIEMEVNPMETTMVVDPIDADGCQQQVMPIEVDPTVVNPIEVDPIDSSDCQQLVMPRPYQISPADLDVKEISKRCAEVICNLEKTGLEITFAGIYQRLQGGGQVITPAVVFSTILALASKNNFSLQKVGDNDFVIKKN